MITAFARAFAQLLDRRILGILGVCTVLSLACFVGAWFAVEWLLDSVLADSALARTMLDVIGGLAAIVATWLLFPVVASAFVGLFLDRVANAVEDRYYPGLPPAPGLTFLAGLAGSLRFLFVALAANLLLLGLWFVPVAYPIGYFVVNGFLLGREYFDVVSQRRLDRRSAAALRARHPVGLLATGAGISLLLAMPVVNLVLPVIATAVMVHRFEAWRHAARQADGG